MKQSSLLLLSACLSAGAVSAATVNVASVPELQDALANAVPGTHIVLNDGVYTFDQPLVITNKGTLRSPIHIAAQAVGGVEIKGEAGFVLRSPAAYVAIEGFKFTGKAPLTIGAGANRCRITRSVFELAPTPKAPYLEVSGDDNEIDCNTFQNKHTEGPMLSVQGPGTDGMAQRTWVHHNFFYSFVPTTNNCSAIQAGLSSRSMSSAFTLVEYNLFIQTAGENEGAVCNQSCGNIYRFNTFGAGTRELSLRHGNRCEVYANFFIGSEGLRFFGKEHKIYDNYFQGCHPAIHIGNGDGVVPPAELTSRDRPDSVQVVFNTLVNNKTNVIMPGQSAGLGATNLVFANNIILGGGKAVSINGPVPKARWEGNIIATGEPGNIPATGFSAVDPKLNPESPYHLLPGSPAIGKATGTYTFVGIDIDRQVRSGKKDIGADEVSTSQAAGPNRILTATDVGPNAPEGTRSFNTSR